MPFTTMKNSAGEYVTVNNDYLDKYKSQGYNVDYTKPQHTQQAKLRSALGGSSNYEDMINDQYGGIMSAIRSRLQQNIKQRKLASQPLRNDSEVRKAQELRTVLEQNANAGDRGGVGRENALITQTSGENRLNQINLQEQSDISNMQTEASAQEAQLKAQMLRDLIEQQKYEDSIAREDARYQDSIDYRDRQDSRQSFLDTIGQYYGDYQALINKVKNDGDSSNDWQLGYLGAARQDKIDKLEQLRQAMAAAKSKAEAEAIQQKFENDLKQKQYELDLMKTRRSGSGGLSVSQQNYNNKAAAQQLSGDIMTYLDEWASGKAEDRPGQRADQNDLINYIKANAGVLTAQGVDVNELMNWVKNTYTWKR